MAHVSIVNPATNMYGTRTISTRVPFDKDDYEEWKQSIVSYKEEKSRQEVKPMYSNPPEPKISPFLLFDYSNSGTLRLRPVVLHGIKWTMEILVLFLLWKFAGDIKVTTTNGLAVFKHGLFWWMFYTLGSIHFVYSYFVKYTVDVDSDAMAMIGLFCLIPYVNMLILFGLPVIVLLYTCYKYFEETYCE